MPAAVAIGRTTTDVTTSQRMTCCVCVPVRILSVPQFFGCTCIPHLCEAAGCWLLAADDAEKSLIFICATAARERDPSNSDNVNYLIYKI